jgi:large subunit ribosomal protein L15
MNITEITKLAGAHRRRKRIGRGESSGWGKTSGRGHKGEGARAGWRARATYEGGQMPVFRRLPKRGFSNVQFRNAYQIVNVSALESRFDNGAVVTAADLVASGLIRDSRFPVKILGNGDLSKNLTVEAQRFSGEAQRKIEAAGGTVKKLGPQPKPKFVKRPPAPAAAGEEVKPGKDSKKKPSKSEARPKKAADETAEGE